MRSLPLLAFLAAAFQVRHQSQQTSIDALTTHSLSMSTASNTRSSRVGIYKVHESGKEPSKDVPTIIFHSGFPDLSVTWSRLAPQFEDTYHVVKICMPDYEERSLKRFWGYSLEDMIKGLALLMDPYYKMGSTIHLVGHDWGAWIALLYAQQAYGKMVNKMVLLDVGILDEFKPLSICYMVYLAFVFFVSRFSDLVGLLLIGLYPWRWIGPEVPGMDSPVNPFKIKAFMCYPYVRLVSSSLPKFVDTMPQLFLFGGKKRFMFHSQEYLQQLKKIPGCDYKEYPECGHWLHWSNPKEVGEDMKRYLSSDTTKN